jgi:hypothetical protein
VTLALAHRKLIRTRRRFSDVVFAMLLALLVLAAPAGAATLRTGFFDGRFTSADPAERAAWLERGAAAGGSLVRLEVGWGGTAPRRPAVATDPADPAYNWSGTDAAVVSAVAAGQLPLLSVNGAPPWAEGAHRPSDAKTGTWRPRARALGQFAEALAKRYSGRYAGLPQVRYFQVWNEPNLATYLTPQWVRKRGRFVAASPGIYRGLLNAAYAGIKRVRRSNLVIGAGTAPYGDLEPGGRRIAPVAFLRGVLARKTHLDAISHHPYGVGGPFRHALNRNDVAVPDLGKLTRVLRQAQRAHRVLPRGRKQLWVTEMSWDSSPPDPQGVPERTQAKWLAQGFYELWRQGVSAVTWFQVGDQRPVPSYAATNQSGVYFLDGQPKLSATAFRFPFVVTRRSRGNVSFWLRSPAGGRVVVEARRGSSWRRVWTRRAARGGVLAGKVRMSRRAALRARLGRTASLAWR